MLGWLVRGRAGALEHWFAGGHNLKLRHLALVLSLSVTGTEVTSNNDSYDSSGVSYYLNTYKACKEYNHK